MSTSGGSSGSGGSVILAPATSARNVIQATADATELTVKGATAQTAHLFDVKDEANVPVLSLGGSVADAINTLTLRAQTGQDGSTPLIALQDQNARQIINAIATTAITQWIIRAAVGQIATKRLLLIQDENGAELFSVNQEPSGVGGTRTFKIGSGARTVEQLDFQGGVFAEASYVVGAAGNLSGINLDVFNDLVTAANSFTTLTVTAYASQASAILSILSSTGAPLFQALPSGGITTAPPSSHTAIGAFGQVAVGTPKQNTTGYDLLVHGNITVTAATAGVINLGVGPTSTPTVDPITAAFSTAALEIVGFTAVVPNNYYLSLTTSGTITVGTPVSTATPL